MDGPILQPGDKIHVMTRRFFADDIRRHFVGEVKAVAGGIVRVTGYAYVYHSGHNEYERRPDERTRVIGVGDAGHIVNVLPDEVDVAALLYAVADGRLVVTDGASFRLDINEFGPRA
jgi:hypothetical protein